MKITILGIAPLLAGWIFLMPFPADAQELQGEVVIGTEYTLFSDILQEERTVFVRVPSRNDGEDARYPVLVLLDGYEWLFHQISAIVRHYQMFGRIPGLIVVGIPSTDRVRDLTPPKRHSDSERWIEGGGGADRFMAFINDELMPFIDETFPTTTYRAIAGGSFGGLFALHAMATRPEMFDAYLVTSPSVWWDDGAAVERVRELFETRDSLAIDVFVTLANESDSMMVTQFAELINTFETLAPHGTAWQYQELPHRIHDTTYFESTYLGLDALFSDWRLAPDVIPQGLDGIEALLTSRADKYGTKRRASTVTWLGPRRRNTDGVEEALSFLNGAVRGESDDPTAYGWLAAMFEDHHRIEEALRNYQIAARLAENANHESTSRYLEHVSRLERLAGRR